jgi:hypothetical protein
MQLAYRHAKGIAIPMKNADKNANRSMPRSKALESRALAERAEEIRKAQRQLVELGESAGLPEGWLETLVEPGSASPESGKPREVNRTG